MATRSAGGGTILASGIRTREKKDRKPYYSDEWALGDDEIEGHHTFNIDEKIQSSRFDINFVKDLTDTEFNLSYIQKHGFNWPLLFREKKQLDIVIPDENFTINDVRLCVGSKRMLDVMDVNTQKNVEMTMKDWQRYYESQDKDKLLNVISLEFSHTKLETLVEAPYVVRQIDWVEKVWPRHLKDAQTESTNVLEDMMYPKVQKYCLMSVKGCYTDFHIDFGGTSVWYHILKGKKIFWLIPPSEKNLQLYEQWVLSGKQSDIFFGDTVDKCARIELNSGNTFFIPTGWIHAVYTPEDSLVFGGNFLHSFGIEKQLRVAHVEDTTHVPQKFRYPFFTEMLWYLLERYVHVLLQRTHLNLPSEEQTKYEKHLAAEADNNNVKEEHIHLTQYELHGLKSIVMYLHSLPTSKKAVPDLIKNPINLIRDVRTVVEKHRYDSPDLAITNKPVLDWWKRDPFKLTTKRPVSEGMNFIKKRRQSGDDSKPTNKHPPNASKARHRRVRCKVCEPCTREDCRTCVYCKDMTKYGGPGTMKQTCKLKKCSQPSLPAAAACCICNFDGWGRVVTTPTQKHPDAPNSLFECSICYKITHPKCISTEYKDVEGIVNEDLANSWECPECVQLGYNKDFKHNRVTCSRISSVGSDTNAKSPALLSDADDTEVKVKIEPSEAVDKLTPSGGAIPIAESVKEEKLLDCEPSPPRMPTWEQLQARVNYPLVRPMWVIRPAPSPDASEDEKDGSGTDSEGGQPSPKPLNHTFMKEVMIRIFRYLTVNELLVAMRVCRSWAKWSIHPSLWENITLPPHQKLEEAHLHGIVRRQPLSLCLDWCKFTADDFSWLIARLPQMQKASLQGLSYGEIHPLGSPYCPCLTTLDVSFCEGINDDTVLALLSPPRKYRPGHRDDRTRLRHLSRFCLAGTQIGDSGVQAIASNLPFLTHLDLSSCPRITEVSPALLALPTSLVCHSLTSLDMRACHRMSPVCLPSLAELPLLSRLALHPCERIPLPAIRVWGATHRYSFDEDFIMTRTPPTPADMAIDSISDHDSPPASVSSDKPSATEPKEQEQTSGSSLKLPADEKPKNLNASEKTSPKSKGTPSPKDKKLEKSKDKIDKHSAAKESSSKTPSKDKDKHSSSDKSTKQSAKGKVLSSRSPDVKSKKSLMVKLNSSKPSPNDNVAKRSKDSDRQDKSQRISKVTESLDKKEKSPRINKLESSSDKISRSLVEQKKTKHENKSKDLKGEGKLFSSSKSPKSKFKSKRKDLILKSPKSKLKAQSSEASDSVKSSSKRLEGSEAPPRSESASEKSPTILKIAIPKDSPSDLSSEPATDTGTPSSEPVCRRSERRNKGRKYKQELMARKQKRASEEAKDISVKELPRKESVKDKLLKASLKVEIPKQDQIFHEELTKLTSMAGELAEEEDPLKITPEDLNTKESLKQARVASTEKNAQSESELAKSTSSPTGSKSPFPSKKIASVKKSSEKVHKVRVKDIMTRSKRQRRQVEEGDQTPLEEDKAKTSRNPSVKTTEKSDDESRSPKSAKRERELSVPKIEVKDEVLKIRKIQTEGSPRYISKLRAKSADGDSSPSSSSEERPKLKRRNFHKEDSPSNSERKSRLEKAQEDKHKAPPAKSPRRKTEDFESASSKKGKEDPSAKKAKDTGGGSPTSLPLPLTSLKKRKERTGSSSSSSPSSPASKASVNDGPPPSASKLCREAESTSSKAGRRRSDSSASAASSVLPPSSACPPNPSPTQAPPSGGSRDRPERQHRSPRRLSMCQ